MGGYQVKPELLEAVKKRSYSYEPATSKIFAGKRRYF